MTHIADRADGSDRGHHHGHHHHEATCCQHASAPIDTTALISGRAISLMRGGRPVLDGVDIDIHKGEIVTLIGPNGAGKTTLVRVLLGLEAPDRGTIRRRDGLVVGYAPQRFDLDPAVPMTVERFLSLARAATPAKARSTLESVGAGILLGRQIAALSGGELQRVILARALVGDPDLLVLDEPVRGVDFMGEAELYTLIGRIRTERGLGVLLISHDLHVVMAQSDRVLCLNRHICCSGRPHAVAQHPEYVRLFGTQAAAALAVYHHHHDHTHDLDGAPHRGG